MSRSKITTNPEAIDRILNRGIITSILPSKDKFREKLLSGEKLRIYMGVDPTSNKLHLSHAKNYMLMEELRNLGHEIILLFGTFTARIGDPTDLNVARARLSAEEIMRNVESWKQQIKPLINFEGQDNPPIVKYNHEWLSKLNFEDVMNLASNFTVQQMIERDMFEKRMKGGKPIHLHEFLYPLMQGYDSVALDVDAEIGGTDQTFNMLAGRLLVERLNNKQKFVIVVNLMEDPKTGALMSKSAGNGVFLDSNAEQMYGEIMSQNDEMIKPLFINCTRIPLDEWPKIESLGPKVAKMRIAKEIVAIFYGQNKAEQAEGQFEETFSNKGIPKDIKTVKVSKDTPLVEVLMQEGLVSSKTEFNRLNKAGAIEEIENGVYRVGKHRFIKIEEE